MVIAGVPRETYPGEKRVALIPAVIPLLKKAGLDVLVEKGAGSEAGFPDQAYVDKGAAIAGSRAEVFEKADILLQVRTPGANPPKGQEDVALLRPGQALIGFSEPLSEGTLNPEVAKTGASLFSMELMPRITRAQSMDALSSMATVAGYKAVLLAASTLPRMFPLLMTAAGTIAPARVFVIGAGVAGLQAIASAKRLGAKVKAYDVRPAVKEQIESLGGVFVEIQVETAEAEDKGGYAKAQSEEFYKRQREMMKEVVADSDVVITTAAVPGKKAPVLVTEEMVRGMDPGGVIVDLAAERGGNCELTQPGQTVIAHDITIIGTENLPATIPYHASQMYSKNVQTFLSHLVKEGELQINLEDEITAGTLVCRDGEIVNERVREVMGLPAQPAPPAGTAKEDDAS